MIMMFKANDKVLMCVNDGLATKGWTGVVRWVGESHLNRNIGVLWDNGQSFFHSYTHLIKKGSFYFGATVVLLHSDGGYRKGLKGTVINYDRTGVKVRWGARGAQWHLAKSIHIINDVGSLSKIHTCETATKFNSEEVDPNIMFKRRK